MSKRPDAERAGSMALIGPMPPGKPEPVREGPQAFLAALPGGRGPLRTHFHRVDQFQFVIYGDATMANHPVHFGHLHFSDRFQPYGPIQPDDGGLTFLTLRARTGGGVFYMPESQPDLADGLASLPESPRDRRNIVFDVGGVLVRLHYQPFIRYLGDAGIDMTNLPAWLSNVNLEGHERGEITGHELLGRIAAMAPRPLDAADLHARWLGMFERWDEMFDLATGLMDDYRVYLLSNVGDLHWAHLRRVFGLHRIAHDALPSFEAGVMKPEPLIYELAERRFGLDPATTVFIDDREENVASARTRGWYGVVHADHEATVAQLEALGVRAR